MVTEHLDDGEGEILRARAPVIGKDVPLVASLDLHANVTPEMVEHADALVAYRTYPHVDMAETGRAAAKHLALLLKTSSVRKGVPAIAVPDPDQLAMHQRPADQGHLPKARGAGERRGADAVLCARFSRRRLPRLRAELFAYGRRKPMPMPRPTQIAAIIESHEDDFDGKICSPDEGVRHAMELAKTASKPIVIADTQDNPGAGGDSDTTGMLRALVRNKAHPRRDRRDLRSAIRAGRACGRRRRHRRRWRSAASRGFPATRPIKETFVVEKLSDGKFVAPGPYYGGRDMDMGLSACLRIGDVRVVVSFAQGAARRSIDVSLCRHRADRAGDPRQQELGAFPRRFRADRRKASDLRRSRRDAGRYRQPCPGRGCARASASSRTAPPSRPPQITLLLQPDKDMPTIDRIDGFADELTAIRRDLHAHPEIGFEEVRTSGIVADKLKSWGIEVHRGLGGTGVVGVLKGKGAGSKRIGLRADMDALPMEENTNLKWRSTIPGRFHGCGHDGHTTMLLGTARYLAETRNFDGTVHFIFQPAEEGLGGARAMIKDGLFEKFPCDEVYGLHNAPDLNHRRDRDPARARRWPAPISSTSPSRAMAPMARCRSAPRTRS